MEKQCPVCKSNLRVIPAGVSKMSGKPYPSFYACPNKCSLKGMMDTRVESDTPKAGGFDFNAETQMKLDSIGKTVGLILDILNKEVGDGGEI